MGQFLLEYSSVISGPGPGLEKYIVIYLILTSIFGDMEPTWMDVTPVTPTGHSLLHVFCGINNSLDQDQEDIFAIEFSKCFFYPNHLILTAYVECFWCFRGWMKIL